MAKTSKPFSTEAALCARFIAALPEGWTAFAECNGWDILLVRKVDGFQIGIEAKLRLNALVISQALEQYGSFAATGQGPDCRAVLVPEQEAGGFGLICEYIGLTIITARAADEQSEAADRRYYGYKRPVFRPELPDIVRGRNENYWYEWAPSLRHQLPEYVPDVIAGSPSPVQLTSWKIAAIKIAITLEKRGFVVRADFKHLNIDHRRWLPSGAGWLVIDGNRYRASVGFPDFKKQHPRVWSEIEADVEKWMLKDPEPAPVQGAML